MMVVLSEGYVSGSMEPRSSERMFLRIVEVECQTLAPLEIDWKGQTEAW